MAAVSSANGVTVSERISVGGHFLGLANYVGQENDVFDNNERQQFDYAVNLDFTWSFTERITGIAQLQSSPGRGSFGFPGPEPVVSDLNLRITFPKLSSILTVGSFDAPIGVSTEFLTNNADATANAFFLNSLYFSALGGETGTLNAVGVMGEFEADFVKIALSGFNGMHETSSNADGVFSLAVRQIFSPIKEFRIASSFVYGRDAISNSYTGKTRTWLADAEYLSTGGVFFRAYYGDLVYEVEGTFTRDDMRVWMGEFGIKNELWGAAVRLSGWFPEDDNGNYAGVTPITPPVGFAIRQGVATPPRDQDVIRSQIAASAAIVDGLSLKAEYFHDDYKRLTQDESTDINGATLLLQGSF